MSPFWQGFWLGVMVAWTPSLAVFALLLRKAPDAKPPNRSIHLVKNKD